MRFSSRHFAFLIETGQLGRGELERAIMARHGATGFGLGFAIEGGSLDSAKESYFDDLNRLSSGNVFAAIFYWLQSIESVEKNIIVVGPIKEIDLTFLHSLPFRYNGRFGDDCSAWISYSSNIWWNIPLGSC